MAVQYLGLKEINGPLVALDNVTGEYLAWKKGKRA